MRYLFLPLVLALTFVATLSGRTFPSNAYASARSAAQLYTKECASCHGRDGRAKTLQGRVKHARNLADPEWQGNVSDERLFNSIMNGKRKMPAYAKKFSEPEIEAMVAYVRALKK